MARFEVTTKAISIGKALIPKTRLLRKWLPGNVRRFFAATPLRIDILSPV
jgi:hypothetical protein